MSAQRQCLCLCKTNRTNRYLLVTINDCSRALAIAVVPARSTSNSGQVGRAGMSPHRPRALAPHDAHHQVRNGHAVFGLASTRRFCVTPFTLWLHGGS